MDEYDLSHKKAELAEHIKNAFKSVVYPGDENIASQESLWDEDVQEMAEKLRGKHWTQITCLDSSVLFYLTPEAYQFYLPAFMLGALNSTTPGGRYTTVTFTLVPPAYKSIQDDVFLPRVSRMTLEQREAIQGFLMFIWEQYSEAKRSRILEALKFWSNL